MKGWLDLQERHPDARAGCAISITHERYSLGKVMSRFRPKDDSMRAKWVDLCKQAGNDQIVLAEVLGGVRGINCELDFANDTDSVGMITTGSPPRDTTTLATVSENLAGLQIDK